MSLHRLCIAPMMDWTDRHCRYFLRGFSPSVLLYTEMITAEALLRGDAHSSQREIDAARRLYAEMGATAQVERLARAIEGCAAMLPSSQRQAEQS